MKISSLERDLLTLMSVSTDGGRQNPVRGAECCCIICGLNMAGAQARAHRLAASG